MTGRVTQSNQSKMLSTLYQPDKFTLSRLSRISSIITIQAPIGAGKSWILASITRVINSLGLSAKVRSGGSSSGSGSNSNNSSSNSISNDENNSNSEDLNEDEQHSNIFSWSEDENGNRDIEIFDTRDYRKQQKQQEEQQQDEKENDDIETDIKVIRNNIYIVKKPRHMFIVVGEPVKSWTEISYSVQYKDGSVDEDSHVNYPSAIKDGKANILQLFGDNMKGMAFPFQIRAFTSRIELIANELGKIDQSIFDDPTIEIHIISERSITTDKLFFQNLYDSNMVKGYEWEIYNSFYNMNCAELLEKEDIMVYLNTSVKTCKERIGIRGRVEEKKLSYSYLESLDDAHKALIQRFEKNPKNKVFNVDTETELRDKKDVDLVSLRLLANILVHLNTKCQ